MNDLEIVKTTGLQLNKSGVEAIKQSIFNRVENGDLDPLQVQAAISFYQKVFEGDDKKDNGLKHLIKKHALNEFSKHQVKELMIQSYKVEEAEVGVKYDYSHDTVWEELMKVEKAAAENRKSREELLKGVPRPDALKGIKPMTELRGDEIIELYPPVKTSTTALKFTLK